MSMVSMSSVMPRPRPAGPGRSAASLTEVAYSPCDTMVLMVRPSAWPAPARYALALSRSRVGQGRAFGSDLYAGDVMGPVTSPSPRAAVSSTIWRSMAHWMASRTSRLSSGATRAFSWSTWYASCGVLVDRDAVGLGLLRHERVVEHREVDVARLDAGHDRRLVGDDPELDAAQLRVAPQ